MRFAAIDFETANSSRNSICAVGLAVVEEGRVVERASRLVRPPDMRFDGINISIHGIRPQDVADQPGFGPVWRELKPMIGDRPLLAHNASFDMSVLRHGLDACGGCYPTCDYFCTLVMSRRLLPDLGNHRLDTLAELVQVTFRHHDALEDALACASIALDFAGRLEAEDLYDMARRLQVRSGRLFPGGYQPCGASRRAGRGRC